MNEEVIGPGDNRLLDDKILRLPLALASRHARFGSELHEELQGAVTTALLSARDRYDPARGAFGTYAFWRARGAVSRVMRTFCQQVERRAASLEKVVAVDKNGEELHLHEVLPDRSESVADSVARRERAEVLHRLLGHLSAADRRVLVEYCGQGRTLLEIGQDWPGRPICREAVRQRLGRALLRVRRLAKRLGMNP